MFWRKLGRPPLVAAAAAAADRARCHRAPSASAMAAAMMLLQCRRHLSASAGPLQPPPAPVAFAPPRTLPLDHERERLRKAVETIQSKAEARIYLSQFAEVTSRKFAIVAVESKLSEDELNELVSGLSILHKFGLFPVVVHSNCEWENDYRATPTTDVPTTLRQMHGENIKLVTGVEKHGGRAMPILSGVFSNVDVHEYASELPPHIDLTLIEAAIRLGHLPVLGTLSHGSDGKAIVLNPAVAVAQLASVMQPLKVIFVRNEGGLLKAEGAFVNQINLSDSVQTLSDVVSMDKNSQHWLTYSADLLRNMPRTSSAVWIRPDELIHELFTHVGSETGTLIRRGTPVSCYRSLKSLDLGRLKETLEASFGKELVGDYFDIIAPKNYWVYIAGDYEGLAVIYLHAGVPYLCKFSVHPKAQGTGIADILWQTIRRDHADLFWRSRADNNINNWYFQRAHGNCRVDRWKVFWYGLRGFDMMQFYKDSCGSLPATFHQKLPSTFS